MLECFQYSLTGRLGHGLVHNLNGPLQILSMQMEMMKMDIMKYGSQLSGAEGRKSGLDACQEFLAKAGERVEQAAEVMGRLETMIQIIGYRGQDDNHVDKQARPVEMAEFLSDLLEFWNADLYFKHRVEKHIKMPEGSIFVNMEETPVLSMFDGLMSAFLYCIKAKEGSSFGMSLEPAEGGGCCIELDHTGMPIPDDICARVAAAREDYNTDRLKPLFECSDISHNPELLVALVLSAVRSVDAGWSFELAPDRAVVSTLDEHGTT